MKFIWIQFLITEHWIQPQGWESLGFKWNYIRFPFWTLLIIHSWTTIEAANLLLNPEN